jgi:hypothetical protein
MPALSFVPVTGPATFRAADPPREGVVEFSDERRTVALPIRAALPVLTRAHTRDDLHPSVALLSGAALLGMRLVAAGKFEPAGDARSWRVAALDPDDRDRVSMLARSRAHADADEAVAEGLIRELLDAVADAMPRSAPVASRNLHRAGPRPTRSPTGPAGPPAGGPRPPGPNAGPAFAARLQARIEKHLTTAPDDRPQLVTLSLRVEADEEELVAGAVRLVLQVHDEQNPLHVCDRVRTRGRPRVR